MLLQALRGPLASTTSTYSRCTQAYALDLAVPTFDNCQFPIWKLDSKLRLCRVKTSQFC